MPKAVTSIDITKRFCEIVQNNELDISDEVKIIELMTSKYNFQTV